MVYGNFYGFYNALISRQGWMIIVYIIEKKNTIGVKPSNWDDRVKNLERKNKKNYDCHLYLPFDL